MNEISAELFRQHYKNICYFAWKLTGDKDLAEDLAQDAFVALMQKNNVSITDIYAIKSFLYTNVKFSVYNLSRKNQIIQRYWQKINFSERDELDLEHLIIKTEFESNMNDALNKLPSACQQIMKLGYVEGYSNSEIAEKLQITVNTIKTQKRRGSIALKRILNPELSIILLVYFFA